MTDPDLGKFGFTKPPAASQNLIAMRLQGPVSPNLSGMHCSQRDHGLRVIFYRQCFTHDDIGASFSSGSRDIRLLAELQPALQLIQPGELSVRMKVDREDQSRASQPVPQGQLDRFHFLVRARRSLLAGLAWEIR